MQIVRIKQKVRIIPGSRYLGSTVPDSLQAKTAPWYQAEHPQAMGNTAVWNTYSDHMDSDKSSPAMSCAAAERAAVYKNNYLYKNTDPQTSVY